MIVAIVALSFVAGAGFGWAAGLREGAKGGAK